MDLLHNLLLIINYLFSWTTTQYICKTSLKASNWTEYEAPSLGCWTWIIITICSRLDRLILFYFFSDVGKSSSLVGLIFSSSRKSFFLVLVLVKLSFLSHAGQNHWMLIGWDRGHFFLIKRALLVIKRAWLPDADWLSTPALNWFPASNGFWKRNFRNASLLSLILTRSFHLNVKENQHATKRSLLVEKQKDFFRPKTY